MIRRIIVYTYGDQSHENAINAAAILAKKHQASLTGLFVKPDFSGYTTVYGAYPLNLTQTFFDLQAEFASKVKTCFTEIANKHELPNQWHEIQQYEAPPKPSNYADLIVVSQPDQESSVIFNDTDFVDHLITDTGLPTVVIPRNWQSKSAPKHIVLGWKECREAVGAVRHSLTLMRDAEDVHVVSVTKKADTDADLVNGIEITSYLTEHDVQAEFFSATMDAADQHAADTLIRHVQEHQRDLIIIGGYGHSRFREIILGGVTRSLIKESTVPVLLSH